MYFGRMIRLERIIHDLLLENDCVSIPKFGGLVAQRFRAEINYGTNIMRPPSKRISFHEGLTANSHLLISELAKTAKLSVEEANEFISQTIKNWYLDLAAGNSIKVDGIGRFYQDKNGAICFNQSLESNFDLDAFGLDIFRATIIKREAGAPEAVQSAILKRIKKDRTINFPYWQAAAVFTGIGALLTMGFMKSDINLNDKLRATFNPLHFSRSIEVPAVVSTERVLPTSASEPKATPATTTPEIEATIIVDETPAPVIKPVANPNPTPQTSNLPYHVVVGSFKELNNAADLIERLAQMGYQAEIIDLDATFKKVSIQSYATRTEAARALNLYKGKVNKGAWIYTRK